MEPLKTLKLVALDLDGVALHDTFSPVIRSLLQKWGIEYGAEIENNVFSQPRRQAALYLKQKYSLPYSGDEIIRRYFQERSEYLHNHPHGPVPGLEEFLERIKSAGVKLISYGGLEKDHFTRELDGLIDYFDDERYICTNDFRPGIKEIVTEFYHYDYREVLFIDDVNRVAIEAKKHDTPFIGVPSSFEYGFQREEMLRTGVKYLFESIREIDESVLSSVDRDAANGAVWGQSDS